ncbi:MAG: hypothetical protein VYE22_25820 [Myxococcota bacterium]|nr:hypothetical protein [Myxococcota bacterium]
MRGWTLWLLALSTGCSLARSADDFRISTEGGPCTTVADCLEEPHAIVSCLEGTCRYDGCEAGFADCNGSTSDGCEVELASDDAHCGACGVSCDPAHGVGGCEAGACALTGCLAGWDDCDGEAANGCESDLGGAASCGGCGNVCAAGELCDTSGGGATCSAECGGTVCGDGCVDTETDVRHCGACGRSCDDTNATGVACVAGACALDGCVDGFEDCNGDPSDGCEARPSDDPDHCGACGVACEGGAACVSGRCDPFVTGDGDQHTCVVRESGRVYCWGRNLYGQADPAGNPRWPGRPTVIPSSEAPGAAPLRATAVATGTDHSCVIRLDGTLACWGRTAAGRLGHGSTTGVWSPVVDVTGASDFDARTFTQLDAEGGVTCALDDLGGVWCWGDNGRGQTGQPTASAQTLVASPVALPGPARQVEVNAASCALLVDGRVFCWGPRDRGQLGDGSSSGESATPVQVVGVSGARRLLGHWLTTCAIDGGGALLCWGDNLGGALGARGPGFTTSVVARESAGVLDAWAGIYSLCWRKADGVRCAGRNTEGQFGDGTTEPFNQDGDAPIRVSGLDGLEGPVFAGRFHACGPIDGALRCWGASFEGQVARSSLHRATPAAVLDERGATPTGFSEVSLGHRHGCAVGVGAIECWGDNGSGQLGSGRRTGSHAEPVEGLSNPVEVDAGFSHTCAVDRTAEGRRVRCWGSNNQRALGVEGGGSAAPGAPTGLPARDAISLTTGYLHSCAVLEATPGAGRGAVWCWGLNAHGQLGRDPTGAPNGPPAEVPGITDAVQVEAGTASTCARLADGTVRCWGRGVAGVLGNGTYVSTHVPSAVSGLSGARGLEGGDFHFCARLDGGALRCWGLNDHGQLGDGTRENRSTPVAVDFSGAAALSVAAGDRHTCAAYTDGVTRCWGRGAADALGTGTTDDALRPAAVMGASGATAVAAGSLEGRTSCAVMPDTSLRCWGFDLFGATGAGAPLYFTPTTATLP